MRKGSKLRRRRRQPNSPYTVFLSHGTADKWIARVLCEKNEETGAATFRDDRDINGGEEIPDAIREAIMESDEMVVLMTPLSIKRPWVNWEIGGAWLRGEDMRVVAVLYHVNVSAIPAIIRGRKVLNLNDFDDYLVELAQRMAKRLK